jgi:hypothetical protein
MMTVIGSSVRRKTIGFSLYVLLGLYALLYNPILVASGTGVIKPLMIVGVLVLVMRELSRKSIKLNFYLLSSIKISKNILFILFYLSFGLLFGQLIAQLGGGGGKLLEIYLTIFTALIPLAYVMVRFIPKSCNPVLSLVAMTAIVGALQAVFIFLDWSYPDARALLASIVIQPKSIEESFRAAGLTSLTGDGLSFSQALCGGCAFYLSLAGDQSRARLFWLSCFTLILFSLIPVARTGIVVLFFFVFVFFTFFKKSFKTILILVFFIIIMLTIFALILNADRLAFFYEIALPYAFEFVFNYFDGDGFRTASTDELATMFVLPNDLASWLLGDGYFIDSNGANYMATDIGYLRILFYVGLIGSFFIYSWFLMVAYACIRRGHYMIENIFFVALFGCIFVANIKFPFVLENVSIAFSLLFLFSTHMECNGSKTG